MGMLNMVIYQQEPTLARFRDILEELQHPHEVVFSDRELFEMLEALPDNLKWGIRQHGLDDTAVSDGVMEYLQNTKLRYQNIIKLSNFKGN